MQTARNVLVVDDEPQVCSLICEELGEHGFTCQAVTNPVEARPLVASDRFGLMITDIRMPQVSGLDLLVHARQHAPLCKVILISAVLRREYLAQAIMLGAYDYVEKPFRQGELAEVVRRAAFEKTDIPPLPVRAAAAMQLSTQARQASLDSIRALVRAVEAKDPYTRQHSEQVAYYATSLARAANAPRRMIEHIRIASLLHDIGKIGVPDRVLTKPGALTADEFEYIRRHPALGADILSNISMFGWEAQLVRHHHERWDGQGYPDGLAGEEIPLASRIIHVADAIDAMLMKRTYKESYPVDTMLAELELCAGSQFDPHLSAVASAWCRNNPSCLILPDRRHSLSAWEAQPAGTATTCP